MKHPLFFNHHFIFFHFSVKYFVFLPKSFIFASIILKYYDKMEYLVCIQQMHTKYAKQTWKTHLK